MLRLHHNALGREVMWKYEYIFDGDNFSFVDSDNVSGFATVELLDTSFPRHKRYVDPLQQRKFHMKGPLERQSKVMRLTEFAVEPTGMISCDGDEWVLNLSADNEVLTRETHGDLGSWGDMPWKERTRGPYRLQR